MSNVITAYFKGRTGVAEAVYQNDYGMIMAFDGIYLPAHFDCYFSVSGSEEAIPGIGADNRVAIPNAVLAVPGKVEIHIPMHTGENDSEVEYVVYFKVINRSRPVDDGTPVQMTAIEQALALLQNPIGNIEAIVEEALSFTGETFEEMQEDLTEWKGGVEEGLDTWKDGVEDGIDTFETQVMTMVGTPLVAGTVSGMTDHSKIYVYTGSETGYTAGNWYYWNGSAWTSGGTYNSTAFTTDTTLTASGAAADSKTVGDKVSALKEDLSDTNDIVRLIGDGTSITPTLVPTDGLISSSDGQIVSPSAYYYSQLIPVFEGMMFSYTVKDTSSGGFGVAFYASENSDADLTKSIKGTGYATQTGMGVIPNGIKYARICSSKTNFSGSAFTISSYKAIPLLSDVSRKLDGNSYSVDFTWKSGLILYSDGSIATPSAYTYSQAIPVYEGMRYSFELGASTSVLCVAFYKTASESENAIIAKSIRGNNVGLTGSGVVPSGVNYMRVCNATTVVASPSLTLQDYSFGETKGYILKEQKKEIYPYTHARRPVIGFILDGNYDENDDMHDVFEDHGVKCGFAIPYIDEFTVISKSKYYEWMDDGYEIGAHGQYAIPESTSYTDEEAKTFIKASYDTLTAEGFDVKFYIGSSGQVAERFVPTIQQYYDWAATLANHGGSEEPCILFGSDKPYRLWRYSMQTSTLAEQKSAVDRAISENGLLLFYGHARSDTSDYFTTANLDSLLDYIESKGVKVATPTEAVKEYFSVRYDDIYSLL